MTQTLDLLHACLRYVHIGLGFAGLALFWWIMAAPKGTRGHLRAGKLFVLAAYVVGGSALFSSLWAVVHVDSFASFIPQAAPGKQAAPRELYRFLFLILLYLSAATISGAVYGVRLMRAREAHGRLRQTSVLGWLGLSLACAMLLTAFGVYRLTQGPPQGGPLPLAAYLVPLLLGLFGTAAAVKEMRYVLGPQPAPRNWLYKHVENLLGTGIAFHTAFIVFGAGRLFGFQFEGPWALAPWVGPPVVGTALASWYVRRLKVR
ncbi:MAG: hypothetical protein U0939_03615 [Pirellulales bacterium]